jgi:hypothetical protein
MGRKGRAMLSDVQRMRMQLFLDLQGVQGKGFVNDDDEDCKTFEDIADLAEGVAYCMQSAANKARGFANQCRKKGERDLNRCSTSTIQPAVHVASEAACATRTEQKQGRRPQG